MRRLTISPKTLEQIIYSVFLSNNNYFIIIKRKEVKKMKKLISPSNNNLKLVNEIPVNFNTNVLNSQWLSRYYMFIGNVVHSAYQFHKYNGLNLRDAFQQATIFVKDEKRFVFERFRPVQDTMPPVDIINDAMKVAQHHFNYVVDTYGKLIQTNEQGLYTDLNKFLALGGTADIVLHNENGSVTVVDMKNYQAPTQDKFNEHYKQCLLYGKLLEDNGFNVQDIQIIYPAQEQVLNLPYDFSKIVIP
jgi:hypothetical protein